MSRSTCLFKECKCNIILLSKGMKVNLPSCIYKSCHLLLPNKIHKPNGDFLLVNDIWDFDNVGVSRNIPVDPINTSFSLEIDGQEYKLKKIMKFLICPDCNKGPIGLVCEVLSNNNNTKIINLLSLESVFIS